MGKVQVNVTIEEDLLEWVNGQVKEYRFASVSAAIRYALNKLRGETE